MPSVPKLVLIGDTLVSLYRSMLRIRIGAVALDGELPAGNRDAAPLIGLEAVAAGVGWHLNDHDLVFASRPGFAATVAKGLELSEVFGQWLGRANGPGAGLGGGYDFADPHRGMLGVMTDTAAPLLQCVGAAAGLAEDSTHLAVVFFRRGGLRDGAFHEALRTAADWRLPLLFVGQFTELTRATRIAAIAKSYGAAAVEADGRLVGDVYAAAHEAVRRTRAAEGPSLLLFDVGEIEADRQLPDQQDPIALIESHLVASETVGQSEIDKLRKEVQVEVRDALGQALRARPAQWEQAVTVLPSPNQPIG